MNHALPSPPLPSLPIPTSMVWEWDVPPLQSGEAKG